MVKTIFLKFHIPSCPYQAIFQDISKSLISPDLRSGVKKMAIGHHIGERAHVIEREKNYHTGHEEERQDFINLEEEEADDFNREFAQRSRSLGGIGGRSSSNHHGGRGGDVAAIMPAPSSSARSSPAPLAIMGPSQGQQPAR